MVFTHASWHHILCGRHALKSFQNCSRRLELQQASSAHGGSQSGASGSMLRVKYSMPGEVAPSGAYLQHWRA